MKNLDLARVSFFNTLGAVIYIAAVSLLMANAEKWFGRVNSYLGPVAFLLLFVLSAAVTGALILGRSVLLYLESQKTEAVRLFIYTIGWLVAFTMTAFLALLII